MRISKDLIFFCAYAVLCAYCLEADTTAVARRQANEATTPTVSSPGTAPISSTSNEPSITQAPSNSETPLVSSIGTAKPTAEVGNALSSSSISTENVLMGTSAVPYTSSAVIGSLQTSSDATSKADEERPGALPLPPKITPAIAVAGVILILFGFTYTLIGIKNRWVQTFLSSGFLTSLSVTVLVVYVMKPPVRPAVQGAYMVAAVVTGLVFGAGSLVFKEITEGLGCLLGGFCLSMWVLTLRPGGTVHSTGGKVILIVAFTVAAYSTSFSHYTRPHGIIGATSFAGATAAVLGFDCFTRAGLKEFWLYIWNLNDTLFPLNTNTYSITRGMKVELALTVLVCILGVISQLKLWKVMKDRREKKDAARLGGERERNQMEEAIGRRLEEGNQRERALWENVYGDQDGRKQNTHADSGLGTEEDNSLRKASVSLREVEGGNSPIEVMEGKDASTAKNDPGKANTTIPSSTEDAVASAVDSQLDPECGQHVGTALDSKPALRSAAKGASEASHPGLPPVLPSPSTISCAEETSTRAHKERVSDNKEDTNSASQSDGAIVIPYAMHSKGSSLAVTVDDDWDELDPIGHGEIDPMLGGTKRPPQPFLLTETVVAPDFEALQPGKLITASESAKGSTTHPPLSTADDLDPEEFHRPVQVASKPNPTENALSKHIDNKVQENVPEAQTEGSQAQGFIHSANEIFSAGTISSTLSLTKEALDRVPNQLSHVAMSYRTNEWAKHIATADEPEFDEPEAIPEGIEEELPTHLVERPAPVEVEESKPTATTDATLLSGFQQPSSTLPSLTRPDINRGLSDKSGSSNTNLLSGRASCDSTTRPDIRQILSSQPRKEHVSLVDLSRPASATSPALLLATRGLRSSSSPVLGHNLKTSPIDENVEAEFTAAAPTSISPLPVSGSTFLAQRDSLLRNKHYQFTTRNTASPTGVMYPQPNMLSASQPNWLEEAGSQSAGQFSNLRDGKSKLSLHCPTRLSLSTADHEDMPLSQRKALMQHQAVTSLPETRFARMNNLDAHLPQWSPSAVTAQKRESLLASWRESVRQDLALTSVPRETVETRRAEMLMEKQQSRMSRRVSEATKISKENAFAQAARRSDMQELHKEAMRKMQATANRRVA